MFEPSFEFYGRQSEFEDVRDLILQGEHVAVTGPAGIGKTTLCLAVINSLTAGVALDHVYSKAYFTINVEGLNYLLHYVDLSQDPDFLEKRPVRPFEPTNEIYLVESRQNFKAYEWIYEVPLTPITPEYVTEFLKYTTRLSEGNIARVQSLFQGHPLGLQDFLGLLEDPKSPPVETLLAALERQLRFLDLRSPNIDQIKIIRSAEERLIRALNINFSSIYQIEPRDFERIVAELLEDHGFDIHLTPETRDGGVDIYATKDDLLGPRVYLVECKKYAPNRPIGLSVIREMIGSVNVHKANGGSVVTTSTFSSYAKALAKNQKTLVSLRDYVSLQDWIEGYCVRKSGLILPK